jgi:N-acetylneuraminate synthase/sialic acid synthase
MTMRSLQIADKTLDDSSDCYVIAEIGHNHQGDLAQCKRMFTAAAEAGADAVKLQKRDNRSLFTRAAYDQVYNSENAFGDTYGEHREALEFGRDEYLELQQHAKDLGVHFFATAFDLPSLEFLVSLGVPAIKIASGDLKSTHLLRAAGRTGVPLIVSTGAADLEDVQRAYDVLVEAGGPFALLQCTAGYPPEFDQLDLAVIGAYRELFPDTVVGFSSHDSGIAMATAAYVLGARIVEKHFTLNRALKGTDHAFSLEPLGLRKMVRDLRRTRVALGDGTKRRHPSEVKPGQKMGKKLVAARDLPAGHVLTEQDLAFKSPGDGLWPYQLPEVLGRALTKDLHEDDALDLASLSG